MIKRKYVTSFKSHSDGYEYYAFANSLIISIRLIPDVSCSCRLITFCVCLDAKSSGSAFNNSVCGRTGL